MRNDRRIQFGGISVQQGASQVRKPQYGILAILMIGAFIAFLNNTLLNVALPSIMDDLRIGTATVQWLTTGFMLVNGILIPATAFLIENFSVRRLFLAAMSLFVLGTLVAGNSHLLPIDIAFPFLLAGRMVQASGSAIMMPLLMNVMLVSFPVEKRGAAMGVFGLILMFAPAIGPTLSGWILQYHHWRMLFDMLVPVSVLILLAGFFLLKDKKAHTGEKLDKVSLIMSTLGFGGLLYGFSMAGNRGWSSPHVWVTLPVGVIMLTLFILRQNRQTRPMLNFSVFRRPMFALASAITIILNMAMFSGILLMPIYMQKVIGFSPLMSGLTLLPGALLNAAMSPVNGRLFDKYGARALSVIGLAISAVTTFMMSRLTLETGAVWLMVVYAVRMMGISMVMMPVSTNGLNQLPPNLYPHGTAMNNTLNQVSAAIGTAVLMTVMSIRQAGYAKEMMMDASAGLSQQEIGLRAMLGGINDTFLVSGYLIVAGMILAFFIKRAKPPGAAPAGAAGKPGDGAPGQPSGEQRA
jgi:EmrB/QacA subfamily drug resistance transporter